MHRIHINPYIVYPSLLFGGQRICCASVHRLSIKP